ncbi:hypothetical protein UA08_08803 [Talaromyces atroroseus]|uniref:Uncharacterized protein n=1 Tax=Talaromyces atroroseus TaxID=1441469 RepID=A0A225ALV8_TALAT|nr:hypothetical protein UA08_08803 [Talaromyces atroroseus]OKL55906.1 hypothetical protein UA08_08803 [Talaromyces atroroseus]
MTSLLSRILDCGPKRVPSPIVSTDEVLPCHLLDDTFALRGYTYMWMFHFADVLDPDKLHLALSQLFEMEGWRRLGGRIRLGPNGKAEIHVPRAFTPQRPAVHFTKEQYTIPMSEHPLASRLPRAGDKPAVVPNASEFQNLGVGPGAARCFDDFIYSDLPQFSLHVVTFADGTLVSLGHSHVTTDLGGVATILSAWSLVLANRPGDVPPFATYHDDPMDQLCGPQDPPAKEHVLSDIMLTGWRLVLFGLRLLFESWWNPPVEARTICVPHKTIDAIVQEARNQLPHLVGGESEGAVKREKAFISEGDVLAALATHITSRGLPKGSTRRVMTLMVINMRTRAPSVFWPNMSYVLNASSAIFLSSTANRAQTMSLGELASESRNAITEQATESQIRALASIGRDTMLRRGREPVFGDINMKLAMISNWSKIRVIDQIDFGPAVLKSTQNNSDARGKPIFYHADNGKQSGGFNMPVFIVMGRDRNGNLWLRGNLPTLMWSDLLEYLNKV